MTIKYVIGALLVLLTFVKIFVIISASIAGGDADEQMERMMEEWRNDRL